ncbi:MAG TPA: rhomboid family intramembrane serine protease [Leptolyngbyaceae cyanobacterium]
MDLNYFLLWVIIFWCILMVIWLIRLPFSQIRGWVIVTGLIVAVTIWTIFVNGSIAGLVGGALWGIFILVPLMGMRKATQLISHGRYGEARKLMKSLRWLHPADGWLQQPEILRALEMGQRGEITEAFQILNRYQTNNTPVGRNATLLLYRMSSRWEELLLWVHAYVPEKALFKDTTLVSYYLRSLGETGDLNGLLYEFQRFEPFLEKIGDMATLNTIRMFVLAFGGQVEELRKLMYGPLGMFPESSRRFWLATAEMAAGNQMLGREQLLALSDGNDVTFTNAIEQRLSEPPVISAEVLTRSTKKILERVAVDLKQEGQYGNAVTLSGKKPRATLILIGINILVFLLEIRLGGSENIETLKRLGALVPAIFWNGEWWRILNATFLHFGVLHLTMNMVGLYALGSFVELSLGVWRYLVSYFVSGMGSMFVIAVVARTLQTESAMEQITVGASGAIMGMVGVMGAIMLWGWRRDKSRVAAQRLRSILFIILLQVIFDLTTPQVSIIGHNSGLALGFLIGNLLLINWRSDR